MVSFLYMRRIPGVSPVIVTIVVLLLLGGVLLFLWQVLGYYRKISAGEIVDLPQFAGAFTVAGAASGAPAGSVELATEDDPSIGPADAKLTIVEFIDFECPYSYEASSTVRELSAKYGDRVRFVMRDFPVPELHPNAVAASEAASCAHRQGKFWAMHDRLYALKGALTKANLDAAAAQSGLDMIAWRACVEHREAREEVEADAAAGMAAGVRGTPTFFFNGRKIEGVIPPATFEALVERLAEGA